jgi:hypothetical protein
LKNPFVGMYHDRLAGDLRHQMIWRSDYYCWK